MNGIFNPLDPDSDLDADEYGGVATPPESGVHALPPRLEQLLHENRDALRPAPSPTVPSHSWVPMRVRLANVFEDVGVWWGRVYWGFVRLLRGGR